jgi:hypothetical protein
VGLYTPGYKLQDIYFTYFVADLHPAESLIAPDTRNLTPETLYLEQQHEKKVIDKLTYGEDFITPGREYGQVV